MTGYYRYRGNQPERPEGAPLKQKITDQLIVEIAQQVYTARKAIGWSQEDLARHAKIRGDTVGRLERLDGYPSLPTLSKLADALGLDLRVALVPKNAPGARDRINRSIQQNRRAGERLGGLPATFTVRQAADFLNVTNSHVWLLLQEDKLPFHIHAGELLIYQEDAIRWKAADRKRRKDTADEVTRLGQELENNHAQDA